MTFFNYTTEQWRLMVASGTRFLEGVASRKEVTDYSSLCHHLEGDAGIRIEPHDHALPHVLGEIARQSHKKCALVLPGRGGGRTARVQRYFFSFVSDDDAARRTASLTSV